MHLFDFGAYGGVGLWCEMAIIIAIICTKKQGNSPVSLDSILSVGYNRNVENCPLRGIASKRTPMGGSHEIW